MINTPRGGAHCTCSSDEHISNISTWDIATSIGISKLADVNYFIGTRDNNIQPGKPKRLTCLIFGNDILQYEADLKTRHEVLYLFDGHVFFQSCKTLTLCVSIAAKFLRVVHIIFIKLL